MALGPTNQRDQVFASIAFVALALVGAYWYFVYDPKTVSVNALAAHVDSLDMANQQAKAQMAKGTIEQIRAEADAYRENLTLLRTLVPAGNEVPALLEQISNAARRAHLDLSAVEPEPVIEGEVFDTYRYKVKINGPYHDVATVLANIGALNRVVAPMNLALSIPNGTVKVIPGKQMLASSFELQTYVVRTAPPAAKPKKDGDKPAGGAP